MVIAKRQAVSAAIKYRNHRHMWRKLCYFAPLLFVPAMIGCESKFGSSAIGNRIKELAPFASLCVTEQSTGFDWESGDWKKVTHHNRSYVLEKVPLPVKRAKDGGFAGYEKKFACLRGAPYEPTTTEKSQFASYNVCISIKGLESKTPPTYYSCHESEYYDENGIQKRIECDGSWRTYRFAFNPDGWFHFSNVHSDLVIDSSYKSSLNVSVGHCSRLQLKSPD
jgi:hypothetical protein